MKTLLRRLIFACMAITGMAVQEPAQAATSQSSVFEIGGRKVIIPNPPDGFVRGDGINANWDKAVSSMLPESNRLLGMYVTPEAQAAIRNGDMGGNQSELPRRGNEES